MKNRCFAVILSVITLYAMQGCERESSAGLVALDSKDSATHISTSPVVRFMDSNYVRAVLYAGTAKVYESRMETHLLGGVRVEFFSRTTGQRVSVLTADSAIIDDRTRDMTARGNVVVISDSSTVRTQLMMWNNTTQKLHSTEFVHIASPHETLQGVGFESDQKLEHYTIYKVTGQMMPQMPMMTDSAVESSTTSTIAFP